MTKLLLWLNYGEIMEFPHRNLGCIFEFPVDFPAVTFFNGWPYYDAFFVIESVTEVTETWKVKNVFLNVQNIRTDDFNLVKSLRNTCKWVYFFT